MGIEAAGQFFWKVIWYFLKLISWVFKAWKSQVSRGDLDISNYHYYNEPTIFDMDILQLQLQEASWRKTVSVHTFELTFLSSRHTGAKTNFLSRNYQEFEVWKMWILWKMIFWNCEFCEKWYFEIVNFVKYETLKLWI